MTAYNYKVNLGGTNQGFEKCGADCGCTDRCAEEEAFINALFASVKPIKLDVPGVNVGEVVVDLSAAASELSTAIAHLAELIDRLDDEGRI